MTPAPVFVRVLQEGAPDEDAGVVDEDVHGAELLLRELDGPLGGAADRDVRRDRKHGGAGAPDGPLGLGQIGRRAGHERHPRALLGEAERDRAADAAAGPGDEDRPSRELHASTWPSSSKSSGEKRLPGVGARERRARQQPDVPFGGARTIDSHAVHGERKEVPVGIAPGDAAPPRPRLDRRRHGPVQEEERRATPADQVDRGAARRVHRDGQLLRRVGPHLAGGEQRHPRKALRVRRQQRQDEPSAPAEGLSREAALELPGQSVELLHPCSSVTVRRERAGRGEAI